MTARGERKAVWRQQGEQSHLHCKQVIGKNVGAFVCTLKLGKRGSSSRAIFMPPTPRRFYKLGRDPGLQIDPTSPELTWWHRLTERVTPKFLAALGWEELYWGRHPLCHKRPPNRYTPGRGVSLSGENDVWKCFWGKKMIPASLFNSVHPFAFCHLFCPDLQKCHLEKTWQSYPPYLSVPVSPWGSRSNGL